MITIAYGKTSDPVIVICEILYLILCILLPDSAMERVDAQAWSSLLSCNAALLDQQPNGSNIYNGNMVH